MSMPYQPAPAGPPAGEPPPSHLVWGILVTLFCGLLGIVSIVYAAQVNGRWAAGDLAGARDASSKARLWAIITAVIGLVFGLGFVGLLAAGVITGVSSY